MANELPVKKGAKGITGAALPMQHHMNIAAFVRKDQIILLMLKRKCCSLLQSRAGVMLVG